MNPLHNGPHMHPEENNPAPDPNTQESSTENEVRDSLSRILKVSEETAKKPGERNSRAKRSRT